MLRGEGVEGREGSSVANSFVQFHETRVLVISKLYLNMTHISECINKLSRP